MPNSIKKCGIFGTAEYEVDEEGFVLATVLVGESGLFTGVPPEELRIENVIPPWMVDDDLQSIVDDMNKNRDLPLYIRKAKIKIIK